jgi:hypothetical protein
MVLQYLEARVSLTLVVFKTSTWSEYVLPELGAMDGIRTEEAIAVATDGEDRTPVGMVLPLVGGTAIGLHGTAIASISLKQLNCDLAFLSFPRFHARRPSCLLRFAF